MVCPLTDAVPFEGWETIEIVMVSPSVSVGTIFVPVAELSVFKTSIE